MLNLALMLGPSRRHAHNLDRRSALQTRVLQLTMRQIVLRLMLARLSLAIATGLLVALTGIDAAALAGGPDPLTAKPTFTAEAKLKIALVGDSTVTDDAGWGLGFAYRCNPGVEVINLARGGRASGSYITEGRWAQALELKPDYVLIQFGHNDQPGKGPDRETDPNTTYRANISRYVDEARAAGIRPVLVTSLSRRQWGDDGRIASTLEPYVDVVRQIAAEKNVPLVDLHSRSIEFYHSLGRDGCVLISPAKENGEWDGTHLNAAGGESIGGIVAFGLRQAVPEISGSLTSYKGKHATTQPATRPAGPPALEASAWARSATAASGPLTHQGARTITVAADGSGDHRTVQEAVLAVPENNADRTTIVIGPGVYEGCIVVPRNRPNVTFAGSGVGTTILTYALNVVDPIPENVPPRMNGNGVIVLGDGFEARDITFRNTAGDRGQAMALRVQSDRCVIRDCRLEGWQDTLLTHSGRHLYLNCHIEGRVDFIYGAATAVFQNCTILSKQGGYITAASTPEEKPWGYVFFDCKLIGDGSGVKAYLGRPWRPYASVTLIRCEMGDHFAPRAGTTGARNRTKRPPATASINAPDRAPTAPSASAGRGN